MSYQDRQAVHEMALSGSRLAVNMDAEGLTPDGKLTAHAMVRRAQSLGSIRVVVGLEDFSLNSPDQLMVATPLEDRKVIVSRLQDRVLADIPAQWIDVDAFVNRPKALPLLVLSVYPQGLDQLLGHSLVRSVATEGAGVPVLNESLSLTNILDMHDSGGGNETGSGYTIAILDTGVDTSHPMFSGKDIQEACFSTPLNGDDFCAGSHTHGSTGSGSGAPCEEPSGAPDCFAYHGTLVAAVALGNQVSPQQPDAPNSLSGAAPDADLLSINVYSIGDSQHCQGQAPCTIVREGDVLDAMDHIYSYSGVSGVVSVNLSFIMSFDSNDWSSSACDSDWVEVKGAVKLLESVGISVVAATGNNGGISEYAGKMAPPSCISNVISVSATERSTSPPVLAGYANVGEALDLMAPGGDWANPTYDCELVEGGVWTAAFDTFDQFGISDPNSNECVYYATNGTSIAAPHVAGSIALLNGFFGSSVLPSAARDHLANTGVNVSLSQGGFSGSRPMIDLSAAQVAPSTPSRPASLTVDSMYCFGWHEITWDASTGTVTEYQLQASGTSGFGNSWWVYIGTAESTAMNVPHETWFRVRACNTVSCSSWRNGNTSAVPLGNCL